MDYKGRGRNSRDGNDWARKQHRKKTASEETKDSVQEEHCGRSEERCCGSRKAVDDEMKVLTTSRREEKRASEQRIVHGLIANDSNPGSGSGRSKEGLLWAARGENHRLFLFMGFSAPAAADIVAVAVADIVAVAEGRNNIEER